MPSIGGRVIKFCDTKMLTINVLRVYMYMMMNTSIPMGRTSEVSPKRASKTVILESIDISEIRRFGKTLYFSSSLEIMAYPSVFLIRGDLAL